MAAEVCYCFRYLKKKKKIKTELKRGTYEWLHHPGSYTYVSRYDLFLFSENLKAMKFRLKLFGMLFRSFEEIHGTDSDIL